MKRLEGEYVCAHTCTEHLTKYTQIGNMDVWKGDLTFHFSHGLILLQILQTKAKTKNAPTAQSATGDDMEPRSAPSAHQTACSGQGGRWNVGQSRVRHWLGPKEPPLRAQPYHDHRTPVPGARAAGRPSWLAGWEGVKRLSRAGFLLLMVSRPGLKPV